MMNNARSAVLAAVLAMPAAALAQGPRSMRRSSAASISSRSASAMTVTHLWSPGLTVGRPT